MPILEVQDLSIVYQTQSELVYALTKVSFRMEANRSLGLWGHSGCGKSTIMKALFGLPIDEPGWVSGKVMYDGLPVSPPVDRYVRSSANGTIYKNSVGFYRAHQRLLKPYLGVQWRSIFQEPIYSFESGRPITLQVSQIFDHLSQHDLALKSSMFDDFEKALLRLDLSQSYIENRLNLELSGGECQRIALAMSIAGHPKLLFADEPTTALDNATRAVANELLSDKIKQTGMTLLIASHNREELIMLVDDVVVLCQGEVVERFSTDWLEHASIEDLHPYTRKLWSEFGEQEAGGPSSGSGSDSRPRPGCPYVGHCVFAEKNAKLADRCRHHQSPFFPAGKEHEVSCWLFEDKSMTNG